MIYSTRTRILAVLAAVVILCTGSFGVRAQSAQKQVVRIGYVPVLIYAPLYIAVERGYFADAGIDAQLVPVQGGSNSVVQLAAGNFDAAVGGVGAGLLNASQSRIAIQNRRADAH